MSLDRVFDRLRGEWQSFCGRQQPAAVVSRAVGVSGTAGRPAPHAAAGPAPPHAAGEAAALRHAPALPPAARAAGRSRLQAGGASPEASGRHGRSSAGNDRGSDAAALYDGGGGITPPAGRRRSGSSQIAPHTAPAGPPPHPRRPVCDSVPVPYHAALCIDAPFPISDICWTDSDRQERFPALPQCRLMFSRDVVTHI